jgi:hypothetical protein
MCLVAVVVRFGRLLDRMKMVVGVERTPGGERRDIPRSQTLTAYSGQRNHTFSVSDVRDSRLTH